MRRLGRVLAAALALAAGDASAQERDAPGAFDFYVLALSWSPGFCAAVGDARGSAQCGPGRGLGFVTHGLWPQNAHGYPESCGTSQDAPRAAMEEARGTYPDLGLARHEWRVHGTCSGLAPSAYFRTVREARDKVVIPDPLVGLKQDGETTAPTLVRAFIAANPGLRADAIALQCRRSDLQEIRLCLDRDLRGFQSCPEITRAATCRFGKIRVRAPL